MSDALPVTLSEATWFRRLSDDSHNLVVVYRLDPHGCIYVNPSCRSLLGYEPEEFHVDPALWRRIVHPQDTAAVEGLMRRPEQRRLEFRAFHKDGRMLWLESDVSAIRDDAGKVFAVHVVCRDISDRKDAELLEPALLQAQKLESVGRLAGGVAHDFNNLLTVISGYANLLLQEPEIAAPIRERVAEIALAAERARELTNKLLIFSRKHPCEPRIIAIDRFLEQQLSLLRRLIGGDILIDPQLGTDGVMVRVDPAQLSQMLITLVVNARDAMPDGGTLTVATRRAALGRRRARAQGAAAGASYVSLAIRDTGCGMSPDVQAHLFEPFFTTKGDGHGTGLGLATVYGLVQQAGGFIEVETGVNEGTTMTVFLPAATETPPAERSEPPTRPLVGNETILIVEDEAGVRLLTRTILERLGYTITEASGPDEALRLVARGLRPDLIVTDVVMPNMNGPRLIAEVQRTASDFAVLYVSGFAETGPAGDLHADPRHFLAKPFDPDALARKVRDLLDLRKAHH